MSQLDNFKTDVSETITKNLALLQQVNGIEKNDRGYRYSRNRYMAFAGRQVVYALLENNYSCHQRAIARGLMKEQVATPSYSEYSRALSFHKTKLATIEESRKTKFGIPFLSDNKVALFTEKAIKECEKELRKSAMVTASRLMQQEAGKLVSDMIY